MFYIWNVPIVINKIDLNIDGKCFVVIIIVGILTLFNVIVCFFVLVLIVVIVVFVLTFLSDTFVTIVSWFISEEIPLEWEWEMMVVSCYLLPCCLLSYLVASSLRIFFSIVSLFLCVLIWQNRRILCSIFGIEFVVDNHCCCTRLRVRWGTTGIFASLVFFNDLSFNVFGKVNCIAFVTLFHLNLSKQIKISRTSTEPESK